MPTGSCASAAIKVGTTSTNIAATITRLRPSTSAIAPVNGAVSATASVPAVMMVETCGGAGAEFLRQQRQDRLRRIEIDEGTKAGETDR